MSRRWGVLLVPLESGIGCGEILMLILGIAILTVCALPVVGAFNLVQGVPFWLGRLPREENAAILKDLRSRYPGRNFENFRVYGDIRRVHTYDGGLDYINANLGPFRYTDRYSGGISGGYKEKMECMAVGATIPLLGRSKEPIIPVVVFYTGTMFGPGEPADVFIVSEEVWRTLGCSSYPTKNLELRKLLEN